MAENKPLEPDTYNEVEGKVAAGIVKNLHLLRCCIFYLIATYFSTPKLDKIYAPRI